MLLFHTDISVKKIIKKEKIIVQNYYIANNSMQIQIIVDNISIC